jgi:hypothetical protein
MAMLLSLVFAQILAHHPDFPDPEDEDFSADAYQPFAIMLQCALEPLLQPWRSAEAPGIVASTPEEENCAL